MFAFTVYSTHREARQIVARSGLQYRTARGALKAGERIAVRLAGLNDMSQALACAAYTVHVRDAGDHLADTMAAA